jgi:hypothetical protein
LYSAQSRFARGTRLTQANDSLLADILCSASEQDPDCSRDLDYAGQIMLPEFRHYFFNVFLVGVPTARARRTGEAVGCLVSSEEQHAAALQASMLVSSENG